MNNLTIAVSHFPHLAQPYVRSTPNLAVQGSRVGEVLCISKESRDVVNKKDDRVKM